MRDSMKQWLGRGAAGLLILVVAAGGYGLYRLNAERNMLRKEVDSLISRSDLLQKKFNEQKAQADAMRRSKQEIESRMHAAASTLASMEKEKKQLEGTVASLEQKIGEARGSCEETVKSHKDRFESLRATHDTLVEESNRIIREKNQQITAVTSERSALEAALKQEDFQHKRCREHNSRFAVLTEELVQRYENKGVLGSIGQMEPFTKLKKVEVEKLCQEYRDKIDENMLPRK